MAQKTSGLRSAASSLPKPVTETPPTPEVVDENGNKLKRQTLYLPFGVHDLLRDIAFHERISQQELFRRAIDDWLKAGGYPSWDEAKRKGEAR